MSILEALWLSSLLLAALALAIMAALIVARMISTRRRVVREAERRRQIGLLLRAPPSRALAEDVEPAGALLTDVAIELVGLVRGEEREDFLASAARLGVPESLRTRLRTGNARTRLTAAEALGQFHDPRSRATLEEALDDSSAEVRLTAALALASAGDAPPAKMLVERLGIGTREQSLLAVSLLREIARQKPEEVKALVLDEASPPQVKAAAIEALSASGDYSLVPVIADLAAKANVEADELPRYLAALGAFGHPAAARAVTRRMDAPLAQVRAAAAEAAGRIGIVEADERLGDLLGDTDWWVRLRAAEALVRLGPRGLSVLQAVAESGAEPARCTAALALAERQGAQ